MGDVTGDVTGEPNSRATVEAIVEAIRARGEHPVDEREAESVRRALEEIPRLTSPFDEHADPVHITGSAIVTGPRGVILHKHKRLGIWVQPGGHVDAGETPAEAAAREASEETGLPVSLVSDLLVHVDVHPGPRGHTHLDLRYLCSAPDRDPSPAADESQDVFWLSWDDAIARADDGLRGALEALRPGGPMK